MTSNPTLSRRTTTPATRRFSLLAAPAMCMALAIAAAPAAAQYRVWTNTVSYSNLYGSKSVASYNYPNTGASLVLGISDNPAAGASGTVEGTTDLVGNLTSSWDRSSVMEVPAAPRIAHAYAASDLATASLKAYAQSNSVVFSPYGSSGQGTASFNDMLHWAVAGANANTVTTIGVRYSLDGTYAKDDLRQTNGSMNSVLNFGGAGLEYSTGWLGANPVSTTHQLIGNAWTTGAFTTLVQTDTLTRLVFDGTYQLVGASGALYVGSFLDTFVTGGTIDFSHTGLFSFTSLPGGLSLSSDSGVFPVSVLVNSVPEPETYALMLAGLGVLAWSARRGRA